MTEINGTGIVADDRVRVDFDLGFGSLKLDVDQAVFADEKKIDILVDLLESADEAVLQVINALIDKVEESE